MERNPSKENWVRHPEAVPRSSSNLGAPVKAPPVDTPRATKTHPVLKLKSEIIHTRDVSLHMDCG